MIGNNLTTASSTNSSFCSNGLRNSSEGAVFSPYLDPSDLSAKEAKILWKHQPVQNGYRNPLESNVSLPWVDPIDFTISEAKILLKQLNTPLVQVNLNEYGLFKQKHQETKFCALLITKAHNTNGSVAKSAFTPWHLSKLLKKSETFAGQTIKWALENYCHITETGNVAFRNMNSKKKEDRTQLTVDIRKMTVDELSDLLDGLLYRKRIETQAFLNALGINGDSRNEEVYTQPVKRGLLSEMKFWNTKTKGGASKKTRKVAMDAGVNRNVKEVQRGWMSKINFDKIPQAINQGWRATRAWNGYVKVTYCAEVSLPDIITQDKILANIRQRRGLNNPHPSASAPQHSQIEERQVSFETGNSRTAVSGDKVSSSKPRKKKYDDSSIGFFPSTTIYLDEEKCPFEGGHTVPFKSPYIPESKLIRNNGKRKTSWVLINTL